MIFAAMIELESDGGRIETDIERIEHRARHGDGKVQLVHGWHVRQHRRDRVAFADALFGQI
jgi:hypothetical protein